MMLPLPPFRRVLDKFCALPVAVPLLIEVGLTLLQVARRCQDETRDRTGGPP